VTRERLQGVPAVAGIGAGLVLLALALQHHAGLLLWIGLPALGAAVLIMGLGLLPKIDTPTEAGFWLAVAFAIRAVWRWWLLAILVGIVPVLLPDEVWAVLAMIGGGVAIGAGVRHAWVRTAQAVVLDEDGATEEEISEAPTMSHVPAPRERHAWTPRRIRREWESIAREAGLDTGRRGAKDGRRNIPTLIRAECRPDQIRLTLLPRGDWWDSQANFDNTAARLMGMLGGYTSGWDTIVPTKRTRLGRVKALPRCMVVEIGMATMPPTAPAPEAWPNDGKGWALGVMSGGREARLHLTGEPPSGALIAGDIGSGKTNLILALLEQAHEAGAEIWVSDAKAPDMEHGDYAAFHRAGVIDRLWVEVEDATAALVELDEGLKERQRRYEAGEVPELWLVIDEAADNLDPKSGTASKQVLAQSSRSINRLVRKGRSAGLRPVIALQQPAVEQLGPSGGALRKNLRARILMGSPTAEALRMMFEDQASAVDLMQLGRNVPRGRGLVMDLGGGMGRDVRVLQAYDMRERRARVAARRKGAAPQATQPEAGGDEPASQPPAPVASQPATPVESRAIVEGQCVAVLREALGPMTQAQVARALDRPPSDGTVRRALLALTQAETITRGKDRRYRVTQDQGSARG